MGYALATALHSPDHILPLTYLEVQGILRGRLENPIEVPMRHARPGFSLVELLVVIGIIALLLAILLPVLTHVRRMARATVCLTHLQQLDASYHMYLNANRNHSFPFMEDITSPQWF